MLQVCNRSTSAHNARVPLRNSMWKAGQANHKAAVVYNEPDTQAPTGGCPRLVMRVVLADAESKQGLFSSWL